MRKEAFSIFCVIPTTNSSNTKSAQMGVKPDQVSSCEPSSVSHLLVPEKLQKEQLKI